MSLLKKHIAANPIAGTRTVEYAKLISITPSKPAMVNGEEKAKVCLTIDLDGNKTNLYAFKDSITGYPNFIPMGGVQVQLVLQESKEQDEKGNHYVNVVSVGVGS
jgi:hypothetical protein